MNYNATIHFSSGLKFDADNLDKADRDRLEVCWQKRYRHQVAFGNLDVLIDWSAVVAVTFTGTKK